MAPDLLKVCDEYPVVDERQREIKYLIIWLNRGTHKGKPEGKSSMGASKSEVKSLIIFI